MSADDDAAEQWAEEQFDEQLEKWSVLGQTMQQQVEQIIQATGDGLDPVLVLELIKNGYMDLKVVGELGVCGISRFMYTVGVCYGLDETGYQGRICFDSMQNAQLFLHDWDGITLPKVGEDGCTAIK